MNYHETHAIERKCNEKLEQEIGQETEFVRE